MKAIVTFPILSIVVRYLMNGNEEDLHLYWKLHNSVLPFENSTRIREDTESYSIANLINVERMLAPLSMRYRDWKNAATGAYRVIDTSVKLYDPGTTIKNNNETLTMAIVCVAKNILM